MTLSALQRYILKQAASSAQGTVRRQAIVRYYDSVSRKPKPRDLSTIVARSVERLIAKELVVGFGRKTAQKWFFDHVRLTPKGRRMARKLLGVQQTLPLKVRQKIAGKSANQI
ncbi:MAG: Uncharacterized protein G01um101431_449 [Parcubacteria group bacterium Gr01-1014_31]|nr:MAG: Uncharacterized protein G01um101431_449 [Parcubacteria group bacterium Gr01-1014_31]